MLAPGNGRVAVTARGIKAPTIEQSRVAATLSVHTKKPHHLTGGGTGMLAPWQSGAACNA